MKSIKKHSVKSCAINKISQFSAVKILNKIQNLVKMLKLIQGGGMLNKFNDYISITLAEAMHCIV